MSHVSTIKIKVNDLDAFEAACQQRGVELRRGQRQYRTYGGNLNACDHAVVDPINARAYNIGLVAQKDGSYLVRLDNWNGGNGLNEKVGTSAGLLMQYYGIEVARRAAEKKGWQTTTVTQPDGSIRLTCEPKPQFAQAGAGWAGSGY